MSRAELLDRNLVALGTRHPGLSVRVGQSDANPDLSFVTAKTGLVVPVLTRSGRAFPMHSRFDPAAEGARLAETASEGYLVAFGLGGGYHLGPLLARESTTGVMIVEKDITLLRGILENINLTAILADSRVVVLMDPSPAALTETVLDHYLPVLYGDFASISLRPRWDSDPGWFSGRAEALRRLPESLGRDYTVQTRFGRRWFVHTVANLPRSEEVFGVLPPAKRLLVTAAGPSLGPQLPRIRDLKRDGVLLATDTSLPALSSAGIVPDLVISIDCQIVSYHHFLKGLPHETTLILDLASPPVLARLTDRVLFFSSGHPFSLFINRLYRPFPIVDLTGGSVTNAAVSLAEAAGARELFLFGADFCFPEGLPYAPGTYVFPYFQSRSSRVSSAENGFRVFLAGGRPRREESGGRWQLRTAAMDHYRDSLETTVRRMRFKTASDDSAAESGQFGRKFTRTGNVDHHLPAFLSAGAAASRWQEFLSGYRRRLEALPPLCGPPQDYLAALDPENRQVWATLLPAAAAFRADSRDGIIAVERARTWTMERMARIQSRWGGF